MNFFNFLRKGTEEITLLDRLIVDENIKRLDILIMQNSSFKEIKQAVQRLVKGYQNRSVRFPVGGSLFRAIPYSEKPDRFEKLTYPPKAIARENRANRENIQVLYCSTSKGAPVFEVRPKVGDYLALVEYRIEQTLEVAHVGFTNKNLSTMHSEWEMPFWSNGAAPEILMAEVNNYLTQYLAETFSQKIDTNTRYLYKLTTAIAECLTPQKHLSGLLYPSIAAFGLKDNIVIKKEFIDNGGLSFAGVDWMQITRIDDESINVRIDDFAPDFSIGKSRYLNWKGRMGIVDTIEEHRIMNSDGLDIFVGPDNRILKRH